MSRRDQIRMTDEEVRAFLDGRHTLQVATINPDGTPHLVAMWYAVVDGRVVFWTYAKSQKVKNLQRDPRLTVLVEEGDTYADLRGVSITGRATVSEAPEVKELVGEAIYVRYFGDINDTAREGVAATGRKRAVVTVEPEKVVTWDHRKLGGGY